MNTRIILGAAAFTALVAGAASAQTLNEVRARGKLNCGVSTGVAGFSYIDAAGEWAGFDVDLCRAVAAAIFDDPKAVEFVPTTGATRFEALNGRQVDMLARNSTWTFSRDTDLKLDFVAVNYYDGQGFMVPKALGVTSAKQLDGATVCIQTGTTTELNLADFFRVNNMRYEPVPIETNAEAQQRYLANACDVYTTDVSGLASSRSTFENPSDHVILPEVISKEPLGPVVREDDPAWANLVRWTFHALVIAEEKGITAENVKEVASAPTDDPETNRLLGTEGEFGAMIGLTRDWAVRAISAVGNYSEVFERHIGVDTPVGLERGLNALYTQGGILYAPPFR